VAGETHVLDLVVGVGLDLDAQLVAAQRVRVLEGPP
jgi:hypothetical protein